MRIENYINQIICGDCLEVMKDFPDNSMDLVLTDPIWPNCSVWPEINADELFKKAAKQICRISNRVIIILGCMTNPSMLNYITLPFMRVCWLRYARPNYAGRYLLSAEIAYCFGYPPDAREDRIILGGECVKTNHENTKQYDHPCARSLQHLIWLVYNYSNPKELILDCFNGSGTTCVAAMKLGRRYIGIDISQEYCRIARKRIKAAEHGMSFKDIVSGHVGLFE